MISPISADNKNLIYYFVRIWIINLTIEIARGFIKESMSEFNLIILRIIKLISSLNMHKKNFEHIERSITNNRDTRKSNVIAGESFLLFLIHVDLLM